MQGSAPTRFGRYELLEELAVGGMAELFKARAVGAHGFELPVVIKRILPHLALDASFQAMFIDEAKITGQLQHPKIVQVLELGSEQGELFIVMEYVDGLDVLSLLRECSLNNEPFSVELAAFVAHEVLDALDYAHAAVGEDHQPLGIVHRDISPGNVLISRRGDVKLTDFGIAHALQRQQKTQAGVLKGKYSYMSPEQIESGLVDARSDLFSTATLLAELIMGRHLFIAANELDLLLMVRDVRLERLDKHGADIPASLRAIIERALQRRPDDRFATAGEFRDALSDWLYARGARVGARDFAELIRRVRPAEQGQAPRGRSVGPIAEVDTLTGPTTRDRLLSADEAARVGRELFSQPPTDATADPPDEDDGDLIPIVEAPPEYITSEQVDARRSSAGPGSHESGVIRETSVIALVHDLAVARRQGLLILERERTIKWIYFEEGDPQFARSNLISERLGEFLVTSGVITRDEQQRALAVLPHFGGRMGDTLVGLGLMQPIDAFRYLVQQVRDKVIDACAWIDGDYQWHDSERNPWPTRALGLSSFEILGASVDRLASEHLERWARRTIERVPVPDSGGADLESFGLGGLPEEVLDFLDGRSCLGELTQQFGDEDRLEMLRVLYLLAECRLVRLQ
ncbi:MAG: serine/threonine protein kinase [Deltaproteobacteria bacterium]|nr:serine/threonine protein kinase [Deltaproteobacteria bacterium]